MRRRRHILFFAAVLGLYAVMAAALPAQARQQPEPATLPEPGTDAPLRFQHLSLADGLSQTSGGAFLQDRNGLLWIGTMGGGLNVYDGRRFRVYRPVPGDSTTISHGFPLRMLEDRSGDIWIGAADGLNRFVPETRSFERFYPRPPGRGADGVLTVLGLAEDRDGNLWIGTSEGIARRDARTGVFEHFRVQNALSGMLSGLGGYGNLIVDEDQYVWYGTEKGLWRLDPASGELARPVAELIPRTSGAGWLTDGIVDLSNPDVHWWAGDGLYKVDVSGSSARRWTSGSTIPNADSYLGIAQDPRNPRHLWLASVDGGLVRFDQESETFHRILPDPSNPDGLVSEKLQALYFDRSGLLWIGTGLSGIDRVDLRGGDFRHYRSVPGSVQGLPTGEVRGITETSDGRVWASTPNLGFVSIELDGSVQRHETFTGRINTPWAMEASVDGTVWIGAIGESKSGLFHYDQTTRTLRHHAANRSLSATQVSYLLETEGILWIGSDQALDRLDLNSGTVENRVLGRGADVSHIYPDRRGRLWISTRDAGLARYEVARRAVTWYEPDPSNPEGLSAPWVTSIMQRAEDDGVFWVTTYGGGLLRLDESTGRFKRFGSADGLADDVVYGALEDDEGQLWMSTNRGISRFDPETESFQTFGMERGIQSWEFNQLAFHRSPSTGKMYFGGVNGLNEFDPSRLTTNATPPPVVFTEFMIFNRPVEPGPESPLSRPIYLTDEITLTHDRNSLAFEFAATDFKYPKQNRYRYQLEGLSDDWVDLGNEARASFTNLAPGRYTFRVHGSNADGVWSTEPASVAIRILPPWWRTWWAYAGYVLVLGLGAFAVDRFQRRRLIGREREKTRERELEQAREIETAYNELRDTKDRLVQQEKLASLGQLTAGIAHEIKNPLNFVNNFAELNEEIADEAITDHKAGVLDVEQVLNDLKRNAAAIAQHGKRADEIVRGMMAHAAGESGERVAIDINALVTEYVDLAYHGKRAQQPDLTVHLEKKLASDAGKANVVFQDMGRVLLNLVGNACDAVADRQAAGGDRYRPRVEVSTERSNGRVVIRVADNGGGIPDDIRARIFEPFFTTKPTGTGTGLGLSLSHEIVTKGHGGSLTVETTPGDGSTFIIELPA